MDLKKMTGGMMLASVLTLGLIAGCRFYRGTSKKLRVRGLGLGLSYSRMIARAHGGDLQLIKSSEEGSTFRLTLPKTLKKIDPTR